MVKIFKFILIINIILLISISLINSQTPEKTEAQDKKEEGKEPTLGCVNPAGKDVDWFIILTFPKTSDPAGKTNYAYFDESLAGMEYYNLDNVKEFPPVRLTKELNDKNNSKKEQDTNYFVWNDDMTIDDDKKSASSGKAHSKGVLAYDKQSGFLLVHSLPRFPYRTADSLTFLEDLPDNTGIYAQSFLCVTLNKDEAVKTIDQLLIINPQLIMKHAISDDFVDKPANAKVLKFLKNRGDSKLLDLDIYEVSSKNNQLFTIFSKSKDYGSLPYDTMIPKYYKQAFYVETWTKPDRLAPLCTAAATVNNVLTVKFGNFEYGCNNEHSKWACSPSVVCIGDLNRTGSQTKRGGLTVCITNKVMAKAFNAAILTSEKCENNKEKTMRFLEEEQN